MVSVVDVVGLLVIVGINAGAAALMTRFFRVRLDTRWGPAVFALVLEPVVLTVFVLVLSGIMGLGGNLGSPALVFGITVVLPMAIGIAFDYFWMPDPDDVELPAEYRETS
jgi:hypothetical protein